MRYKQIRIESTSRKDLCILIDYSMKVTAHCVSLKHALCTKSKIEDIRDYSD